MATLTATKSGNWSDPTVWGGSTPADGDTVDAASYVIDFDVDVTQPNTLLTATTGYFRYNGAGTRMVQAKANAGTHTISWNGLINMLGTGTLTFNGPVKGGAGTGAYGAYNIAAGTLNVTTATGGAGSYAYGAVNSDAGTLNVTTATGGAGSYAYGAVNGDAGTLNVTTATGGAGNVAYGAVNLAAGTLRCGLAVGSNWGVGGSGNYAYGVYGSGATGQTTTVRRIQSGPYGCAAIGGAVFIEADASNSAQFRETPGGATLTLVDAAATADFPAASDVRHGVVFDDGNKTGTAYIPAAANVALGIPVDNTTGTAVLTAAGMLAAMNASPPAVNVTAWKGSAAPDNTGDSYARLGVPAGASVSADVAALPAATRNAINASPPAVKLATGITHGDATTTLSLQNLTLHDNRIGGVALDIQAPNSMGGTGIRINGGWAAIHYHNKGASDTVKADQRAAVGLASANLDTQLSGISTNVSAALAELAAILEDTGTTLPTAIAAIEPGGGSYAGDGIGYYSDTIDDGTSPLDGVRVQLYTSPNRVGPAYEAYTNALGVFEMWPDPGTYYRWLDLAGYNFSQDVAVTVTEP